MKKAYFLIGPSGAGKSTFMRTLMSKHDDAAVFSLDTCRLDFFGGEQDVVARDEAVERYRLAFDYSNQNGQAFDAHVNAAWRAALNHDVVIIDNTNLTRKARSRWVQDLRKKGYEITMVEFMIPLQTVLNRQATRQDKSVPLEAVRQHFMRQESVHVGTECDAHMVVES